MGKMKVAIIGCGNIANAAHHPGYAASRDLCEIKYFVDIIPERAKTLRDKYGSGEYLEDYHTILGDSELEAVSVCTPNYLHAPISMDFLNAGKHVLCEKPVSVNYKLSCDMKAAADKNNRILDIGVVNRFNNGINKVRELIQSGELGGIYHVYAPFRRYRGIPGLGGPFTTKAMSGGGALIDIGVHTIDYVLYCLGAKNLKSVSASCYSKLGVNMKEYAYTGMWAGPPDYSGTYDVDDFVTGMIRGDGFTITFNGAWAQNIADTDNGVEFLGDKAGIKLAEDRSFKMYSVINKMPCTIQPSYAKQASMFNDELRSFLQDAAANTKGRNNIDHVLLTAQVLDAIYRSSDEGREIAL
ncbi:MAG: Gfo/Idh/MocA family oxidoreductase [Eubacteriales bacterium]|nr:Gfo/Idh/MocA family oxidoreductase [Eubacteriales bacterium]